MIIFQEVEYNINAEILIQKSLKKVQIVKILKALGS